jgi:hypothetical protein
MTYDEHVVAPRLALVLLLSIALTGCWIEAPPPTPPFDCAAIDRAAERFPDECGDAGVDPDASLDGGP